MSRHILNLALAAIACLGAMNAPALAQSMMGGFVAGDVGHDGQGTASIEKQGDGYAVVLKDFATAPGPDLKVVLVEAANAITTDAVKQSKWVSLGPLTAASGDQTYAIPANIDPANYHTVAIWCETYAVLFTAAPLN